MIAPPKALGTLRKELHKEVERRIVLTVNKEMTDRPIPDGMPVRVVGIDGLTLRVVGTEAAEGGSR